MITGYLVRPGTIEFREVPAPLPSRGEVVVKIKAALTCGTDLKAFLRGHPMIPMPGVFGHEFSGVITETGTGVRGFKPGDEVMAVHSAPCGTCAYCRKRLYNLCENIMNTKVLGAFGEYILLPARLVRLNLFHKPASLSFKTAALLEPLSCVVHGMRETPIRKGDCVLVIGAGPIGLMHCALAKLKGARVLMNGRNRERLDFAQQFGADATADSTEIDEAITGFTGGLGFDYVFECTGQVNVWEKSVSYVRKGGAVVLFGGCAGGTKATYDTFDLHYREIALRGVFHFTPRDVKKAYHLLKDELDISSLISGEYPLRELPTALEKLSRGEGIKYALIP